MGSTRTLIVAMAAAAGITGCSVSVGGASIDRGELEQQVTARLTEQVGTAPKSVECPDELQAEAGATTRCTLIAPDGSQIGMTVTVTGVDGSDINFEVQVDDSAS